MQPEKFSLIWRPYHYWSGASNWGLNSIIRALGQWRFFSVPNSLLHGSTIYKGHLTGPVTLEPVVEHLAVELSYLFLRLIFVATRYTRYSRIFHSYGDVTITDEGLQILNYTQHLMPLSNEVSLACHTYCDTGHPFMMVISENPWYSHLLPSVWQWIYHFLFLRLRSVAAVIRTLNLPHDRRPL